MLSAPSVPWWKRFFGGKAAAKAPPPQSIPTPPAVETLVVLDAADDVAPPPVVDTEDAERAEREVVLEVLVMRVEAIAEDLPPGDDRTLVEGLAELIRSETLELPRLPALTHELLALNVDSPQSSGSVADLLRQDQDATARVMEVANSSRFGAGNVSSLEGAVRRLGVDMVRSIALGLSMQAVIYKVPGYDREVRELRESGYKAGEHCAAMVRATKRGGDPGTAFLAGLFHDVGEVLIYRSLSSLRARTKGLTATMTLRSRLCEELHGPLGQYYGLVRRLPDSVRISAGGHHKPEESPPSFHALCWAVWAADQFQLHGSSLADADFVAEQYGEWPPYAPPLEVVLAE